MAKWKEIRNSTVEFLIFQAENKEQGIEVMYANETIWCTQDAIAALFDRGRSTIAEHLQNGFNTGELIKDSVCRKFRRTASDGKEYNTQYYNLDAIISVGYRANSIRATQFRQWATSVLRQYAIRGYVLDRKRMENGAFLGEDYFEHLLAETKSLNSEIESMKSKAAKEALGDVMDQVTEVNGVKLLATAVEGVDMNGLRDLGDQLKDKLGEGVIVIASNVGDKVNLIAMATDGAMAKGAHAGNLIKGIAGLVGGGGGGRPNMAQAGGKNPAGIPDKVLEEAVKIMRQKVQYEP